MKHQNKNRPSPFPGWILSETTKPGFYVCLFCVVVHFFWLVNCAFVVLALVFSIPSQQMAWETSPKWPILCRVGRETLTQSMSSVTHSFRVSVLVLAALCWSHWYYCCTVSVTTTTPVLMVVSSWTWVIRFLLGPFLLRDHLGISDTDSFGPDSFPAAQATVGINKQIISFLQKNQRKPKC